MKISDLFDDNKFIAAIKLNCNCYGITVPENIASQCVEISQKNIPSFICISSSNISIFQLEKRSKLMGKIIGHYVKNGTVLYFHDCTYRTITPENWYKTWDIITRETTATADDRQFVPVRKRSMLDECMPDNLHKKPAKRGFSRTYEANMRMSQMNGAFIARPLN